MRAVFLVLILLITSLPITSLPITVFAEERQGVIPLPADGSAQPTGNPYVRGIASHAWWLDPEVYGDQLFPALDDLQVTTVRLSIDWRRFEPQPGVFDWSMYDRVLGELAKRNIVIIANLNTIPGWASVDQQGCDTPITEIQTCELREDMYPQFAAAMEAAVTRYAWVRHWEFWNEPEMWQHLGRDGPTYLRHLRMFYDIAKQVNPEIVVAAQTLVGADYMEYIYNLSDEAYGSANRPWDAVSIHPYNFWYVHNPAEPPLEINYDRVQWLRDLMVRRGDGHKKIWITEFGWTNGVEHQTRNLPPTLDWLQSKPYIEFAHLHMLHDWNEEPPDQFGLMAIVPDENGRRVLDAETQFAPKEPFYNAFKNYPTDTVGRRPTGPDVRIFGETGHSIDGRFLAAWEARGGLSGPGVPLTRPYARQSSDGAWRLVQDFERARLEFHPEHVGQPAEVLGAAVGRHLIAGRQGEPAFQPLSECFDTETQRCFETTGFVIQAGFKGYWESHNGDLLLGHPISREFIENGKTVQYFERGRLEWDPNAPSDQAISMAHVVRELLVAEGWLNPDGSVPDYDIRLPTRREFS